MNNHTVAALGMLMILASTAVSALERNDTSIGQTGVTDSQNETVSLSPIEQTRARAWELSDAQWRRYKALMQGIRGSISPATISPIEVLGIHARDDEERRRYAQRWTRLMREDVGRILAFQQAYDEAGKRLYPNEPVIDPARLPGGSKKTSLLQLGDRVLFFIHTECPVCDQLLRKLLRRIDQISGIDIYLTGLESGDDEAARNWASYHQIRPEWVHSRRVTLNHDAGALEKLTRGQGTVPYLMRRRGRDLTPLSVSDL